MPTINITATGDNIKKMRKAAGLTVKDLQNIFGFGTPQAIYKWRNGRRSRFRAWWRNSCRFESLRKRFADVV